jgi:hypothetical protein
VSAHDPRRGITLSARAPGRPHATRLPRARLTVRRLIVAVAVVGIAFGSSVVLWRRAEKFRRLAADHGMQRVRVKDGQEGSMWFKLDGDTSSPARDGWRRALAEKYDRAARYPFLPVGPDPPEPE